MKIKQINKNLHTLLVVFTIFVATFMVASFLPGESVSALKCPGNQKLHSDNLCWEETPLSQSGADEGNGSGVYCESGSQVGMKCMKYMGLPLNDNGSPVSKTGIQCPPDTEFHASDGKCWEKSYTKVIARNEQNCKGTITAQNGNAADITGEAHWDNGSCWVVDGYGDSHDPTGFDPNKLSAAQQACVNKGGDWVSPASGNGGTCKNTEESCKKDGKILSGGTCVADTAAACKAQYPSTTTPANPFAADTNKAARDACIAGGQSGDCEAQTDPALKKACEAGATARNAIYSAKGDAGNCGDAKTNLITCDGSGVGALASVLKIVLFILTILIGIVATGGIVYGAILYASAQDNAGQVSQAKTIIRDVAIGLLLYGFMIAIINWLVPGSVIG